MLLHHAFDFRLQPANRLFLDLSNFLRLPPLLPLFLAGYPCILRLLQLTLELQLLLIQHFLRLLVDTLQVVRQCLDLRVQVTFIG
jgi:hypothetical protein